MSNTPRAVSFQNRNGHRLFGTVHFPNEPAEGLPVIALLSPGVKGRVGPHGLYNRMTQEFTSLGFSVFKFDFYGLGDSEGELNRELLAEVYNDIEDGHFVDDCTDALDWYESEFGSTSFIAAGLCGGAITGLLLAQKDTRIRAILSLGMTVTLAMGTANSRSKVATRSELAALRKGYFKRLLSPVSWYRLLTLKSEYDVIGSALAQIFRKQPKKPNTIQLPENANPLFPPAFFELLENEGKILLIFSEADRLYWNFEEKFAEPNADRLATVKKQYDLHIVKDANHVFSFREWEREMLKISSAWLRENFRDRITRTPSVR